MKDPEIIHAVRSGKAEKAIQKMYSQLSVFRKYVRTCGGNKEEADDIFQEALLIFCKKVEDPGFKLSATLNTYLLAIAKYMWKDEMRKKSKGIKIPLDNINEEFSVEINDDDREEKIAPALKALHELGERCLELLENFYFKKMSMKEIAEKMKFTSEKLAKNQKYKCLERAREKMKSYGVKTIN